VVAALGELLASLWGVGLVGWWTIGGVVPSLASVGVGVMAVVVVGT